MINNQRGFPDPASLVLVARSLASAMTEADRDIVILLRSVILYTLSRGSNIQSRLKSLTSIPRLHNRIVCFICRRLDAVQCCRLLVIDPSGTLRFSHLRLRFSVSI